MNLCAVDLFCGVGGLTKGLELAGINVVAGVDFEPTCEFAYESNNKATFINKDITKMSSKEIDDLYPKNSTKILAGCAPCQPFSKLTKRYRKDGYTDNKWKLLYYFSKMVEDIQPTIVAMENVPELRNTSVFKDFINDLRKHQYYIDYSVVFCPDYGIPQNRKRLVLIASKLGDIKLLSPTYNKENYVTVRDRISNLSPLRAGETDANDRLHTASALNKTNLKRIQNSVEGGTWRDWPKELQLSCHKKDTGKSYPSVYGRMCWDQPSPTITTQFYGYGNGRFGHPEQDRAISLREGAILQSFPPDYKFIDEKATERINKRMLGTQIGNAVPVDIGKVIGLSIINHLKEYE